MKRVRTLRARVPHGSVVVTIELQSKPHSYDWRGDDIAKRARSITDAIMVALSESSGTAISEVEVR